MANDRLTAYKAKRDFQKTREPSGQDAVKPTTRRRDPPSLRSAARAGWRFQILGGDQRAVTRPP
jgi:hypothetical protein